MRMVAYVIGLTLFLLGSSAFAKDGSKGASSKGGEKKQQCVEPAPKYGGQDDKVKSNNGHGNNEDVVDTSNPGKSKQGEDTDTNVDDEKKSGK